MKKFNIEVIRTDEFDIEIDETIWTPEEIEKWSNVFWPANNVEDVAEHLAKQLTNNGSGYFLEGFSYVETYRSNGNEVYQSDKGNRVTKELYAAGIKVTIISEDEDYETNITETNG